MTRRDSNPRPHGRTALSVVCVALVLLFFGGLEEGGLRLGGHVAVAQFGGGLLGALKCGTIGDKTGEGRCGPDTRSANPGQQDPCKACNKKADKLRDGWIDFMKRWDDHIKKLKDEGTYQGSEKYEEDQIRKDLWEEKKQLRRDWEDHSNACFSSESMCKIGKITDKKTSGSPGGSSSAPSSAPQSKPSAPPEAGVTAGSQDPASQAEEIAEGLGQLGGGSRPPLDPNDPRGNDIGRDENSETPEQPAD